MEMGRIEVRVHTSVQVRRGMINWVAFLFRIFLQILKGAPLFISYIVGLRSRHVSLYVPSPFKPLPVVEVELPVQESSVAPTHVASVHDSGGDDGSGGDYAVDKLTVVLDLDGTLVCAYETSSLSAIVHTQATEAGLKWFELECVSLEKPQNGIPCIPLSTGQPHDDQLSEVILPLLEHLSLQKDVRPVLYERFRMPEWFQMHGIPAAGLTVCKQISYIWNSYHSLPGTSRADVASFIL